VYIIEELPTEGCNMGAGSARVSFLSVVDVEGFTASRATDYVRLL
jgi:hypothetical protein